MLNPDFFLLQQADFCACLIVQDDSAKGTLEKTLESGFPKAVKPP